ncbi:MAG TPA: glycosyltransferase family 4 protein [Anaerolineales bacterium]|nr:glycosyltransferase family 4 protein [Anaerolineales bacterium]
MIESSRRQYKIAVVAACPFPYPRGTPVRIYRMAEALANRGHSVHVVAYHLGQSFEETPFKLHRTPPIPTYRKTSPGPSYQKIFLIDPLLAVKLYQVVRKHRVDLIHAHHYEGLIAAWPVARLTGLPLVFDVHTLLASELPQYKLNLPKAFLRWAGNLLDHTLPAQSDHIVTVGDSVRKKLIEEIGLSADRVTTVYTGIEKGFGRPPSPVSVSSLRTLIYAGNLADYQGVDLMLKAFRLVLDQRPDTLLKIVSGNPISPYQAMIRSLRLENNLIIENADYFRLPAVLHTAMIALNPRPRADGVLVKLLNYMAAGCAIVSFSGSGEIIQHERTGLLVAGAEVEMFASAILRLLENPELAQKLGAAAQSTAQDVFVWEKSVMLFEAIYDKLVDKL